MPSHMMPRPRISAWAKVQRWESVMMVVAATSSTMAATSHSQWARVVFCRDISFSLRNAQKSPGPQVRGVQVCKGPWGKSPLALLYKGKCLEMRAPVALAKAQRTSRAGGGKRKKWGKHDEWVDCPEYWGTLAYDCLGLAAGQPVRGHAGFGILARMREPWRRLGFCPVLPNPLFCSPRLAHFCPVLPGAHGWRVYPAGLVARACGRLGKLAKESVPAVGDRGTLRKARRKQCRKKDACRYAGCLSGMGHGISPGSLGQMVRGV